jgi:adenine-specific DNA glycosylase
MRRQESRVSQFGRGQGRAGELGVPAESGVSGLDQDESWISGIQERLMAWYREARRDLPWRASRDPYRILVSEMMLVQTTVTAVIPYFERFLSRFPDAGALAAATESDPLVCV